MEFGDEGTGERGADGGGGGEQRECVREFSGGCVGWLVRQLNVRLLFGEGGEKTGTMNRTGFRMYLCMHAYIRNKENPSPFLLTATPHTAGCISCSRPGSGLRTGDRCWRHGARGRICRW